MNEWTLQTGRGGPKKKEKKKVCETREDKTTQKDKTDWTNSLVSCALPAFGQQSKHIHTSFWIQTLASAPVSTMPYFTPVLVRFFVRFFPFFILYFFTCSW